MNSESVAADGFDGGVGGARGSPKFVVKIK
jgi:hypothetical protein